MNTKKFKDVKPGDIVYKVAVYDYKTRIIKKIVKSVDRKSKHGLLTIHCECKDSEYYANFFVCIKEDSSIYENKYSPNSYLCTNIEDAKLMCRRVASDIVSKAEKEIAKLTNRANRWRSHIDEMYNDNYVMS